jgi:ubiquinol-cytochrome c reductase cytochrome b subunit
MNSSKYQFIANETHVFQKSFGHKKLSLKQKQERFSQWLAGFVDGHGCFLVSKQGESSLEITVPRKDGFLLVQLQHKYGGSLKLRAGYNAVRYRLHSKQSMKKVCNHVNGYICHPVRLAQFQKVCECLCIEYKTPNMETYTHTHGWFAGMFDAIGLVG